MARFGDPGVCCCSFVAVVKAFHHRDTKSTKVSLCSLCLRGENQDGRRLLGALALESLPPSCTSRRAPPRAIERASLRGSTLPCPGFPSPTSPARSTVRPDQWSFAYDSPPVLNDDRSRTPKRSASGSSACPLTSVRHETYAAAHGKASYRRATSPEHLPHSR
jgi:hypothetical protein